MSAATIVMICLICVGCAIGIAGLAIAGLHGYRLLKAARKAGISSRQDLQDVIREARELGPRVRETQERYKVVAERIQNLSATTERLKYLREELGRATDPLSGLKF
ncbi:MAG: hypothetical protein JW990_16310 [Thermoleophilia bacterium]|nr:hypothetical protein [Thermoleophilia bacterium]